jgi:putative transposase
MQTRDYKQCAPETYYHIYNRGNGKDVVFKDHDDYSFFLLRLRQNLAPDGHEPRMFRPLPKNSFSLVAYCLMPNHFHLLIRQNQEIPTSKLIGKLCTSYSKYFNQKYTRVGHVFQDQFKQITVDNNRYLLWLSVYIHLNPQEAGIVTHPEMYNYSSIANYIQPNNPGLISDDIVRAQFPDGEKYRDFLLEGIKNKEPELPPALLLD